MNYSTMLSENHSIPEDSSYMVNLYSEENAQADLEEAKQEADVAIVYLHGGQDESVEPEERLQERVQFLAEQGADVIICSHPHILKGYELIEKPDGKETLVYYSLGNFVSAQSSLENLLGGMADFTLTKEGDEVTIDSYSMIPLVMHYNADYTECSAYKLSDYTDELVQEHGIHEENPEADFTISALEEAAGNAGELHTEWNFQTDETDEEGTDTGESTGNSETDSQSNDENNSSSDQNTAEDEDNGGSGNSSLGDNQNTMKIDRCRYAGSGHNM